MEGEAPIRRSTAVTPGIKRWVLENVKNPFAGIEDSGKDPIKETQKQYRKMARRQLGRGLSENEVIRYLEGVNSESL